jgi:hypothetical protein
MPRKKPGAGTRLKKGWSDSEATARPSRRRAPSVLDKPDADVDDTARKPVPEAGSIAEILAGVDRRERRGNRFTK